MGGLAKGDKPIALTAFILISLLEAGKSPTVRQLLLCILIWYNI